MSTSLYITSLQKTYSTQNNPIKTSRKPSNAKNIHSYNTPCLSLSTHFVSVTYDTHCFEHIANDPTIFHIITNHIISVQTAPHTSNQPHHHPTQFHDFWNFHSYVTCEFCELTNRTSCAMHFQHLTPMRYPQELRYTTTAWHSQVMRFCDNCSFAVMHLHHVAISHAVREIHALTRHTISPWHFTPNPHAGITISIRSQQLRNEDETGMNPQNAKHEMFAYCANCAFCIANDTIHIPLGVPTDNDFSSQFSIDGHGQKTWVCKMQNAKNKIYWAHWRFGIGYSTGALAPRRRQVFNYKN